MRKDLNKMKLFTKLILKEIVYIEHLNAFKYIIKLLFSSISRELNVKKIKNLIEEMNLKNELDFKKCIEADKISEKEKHLQEKSLDFKINIKEKNFDSPSPFENKMNDFSQNFISLKKKNSYQDQQNLNFNNFFSQNFQHKPKDNTMLNGKIQSVVFNKPNSNDLNLYHQIEFYKKKIELIEKKIQMNRNPHTRYLNSTLQKEINNFYIHSPQNINLHHITSVQNKNFYNIAHQNTTPRNNSIFNNFERNFNFK